MEQKKKNRGSPCALIVDILSFFSWFLDPLDTGQKEQESPENVLKELKEVRVFLANVTAIPSTSAANLHWKVSQSTSTASGKLNRMSPYCCNMGETGELSFP